MSYGNDKDDKLKVMTGLIGMTGDDRDDKDKG